MSCDLDAVRWEVPEPAARLEAADTWSTRSRDVVRVSGPDALSYLHSQCSQRLDDLAVGERRWSLVLEPTGHVIAVVGVSRSDDAVVDIDVDPGAAEAVVARLQRFLLRTAAVIEHLAEAGEVDPEVERARVAGGWPRHGAEIVVGSTLPAELGVADLAVSFTKGCYPGQELVERMDSRGASAPWRLIVVMAPTKVGDVVTVAGEDVGAITSSSGDVSIARVKRAVLATEPH